MTSPIWRLGQQRLGWRWLVITVSYVATVSALAALGDTRSAAPLLLAVVVTLPLGLGALIGVYFVYAILIGVARAIGAPVMTGNGWGPLWFVIADEILVTLLFAAVATANALIVRKLAGRVLHRRRLVQ